MDRMDPKDQSHRLRQSLQLHPWHRVHPMDESHQSDPLHQRMSGPSRPSRTGRAREGPLALPSSSGTSNVPVLPGTPLLTSSR